MHVLRNLALCSQVKQILPNTITIVGGHHATLMPEDFFEPQVDGIIVGEGVAPFRKIMNLLSSNEQIQGLPGVWWQTNGSFQYGGTPINSSEELPFPDRISTLFDRCNYYIDWMNPVALLRTSLGCPYRCSFCSLWKLMDGKYYVRECSRIVQELELIHEPYIFLVDDEPFINPRRMFTLASEIQRCHIRKEYFAYCRIDSFLRNVELMTAWRDIGLRRLFFGVEAITDNDLSDYNKRLDLEQIVAAFETAKRLGIQIFSNFIVKPEYTENDFDRLVQFICKYDVDYPSFTILTPLPGTKACETFDDIIELQPNGRPNWELFDLQHPVTQTRLPHDDFMRHYRGLQCVFAPNYARAGHPFYREAPATATT
jgi:radical SAM superfamily enzyme YgiQ (UPF0313 family)